MTGDRRDPAAAAGPAGRLSRREQRERWQVALLALLVAVVVTAAYVHTLPYSFNFDDYESIRDNATLDRWTAPAAIWSFRPSRFVLHYTFVLNIATSGRSIAPMRATNLAIHLGVSLLVGWIGWELARNLGGGRRRGTRRRGANPESQTSRARWAGAVAALVFAAHPLATQAVTYLIQRTTSLAALFELGAIALYLAARRRVTARALWAASWALAVLGAFTKEIVFALPLLIALLELAQRHGTASASASGGAPAAASASATTASPAAAPHLRRLVPFLAVVPIIAVTTQLPAVELDGRLPRFRETADISRAAYAMTQLVVVPRYLRLAVWPRSQNLDHDVRVRARPDAAVAGGALLLLALSVLAIKLRRRAPLVTIGWFWFLIALLPESSIIPISDVMNEHRMYVPLAGLAWMVGAAATAIRPPRVRGIAVALLVTSLGTVTHARNRVWRDELSLWSDVVRKAPAKARGYNNLGLALAARGRRHEAEAAYRKAMALDAEYVYARVNLGELCGIAGRHREALALFEEALAIQPDHLAALNNLGTTWWALGDTAAAAAAYERAIEVAPDAWDPRDNLARLRGLPPPRR